MKIPDKYEFYDYSDIKITSRVIKGKKLAGTSQIVLKYEEELSSFFNSKYSVALSSGTTAIQTALYSLGVRSGDKVVVSSACPSMSVVSILALGATIVFCDTQKDNFGLDIKDLKKVVSPRVKAVIDVPMWGYPTDVITLKKFLKKYKIPLILDLAQAHGTKLNNKYLSYYSDISCFSTHDRKILPTGEGGFCLTNKVDLYKEMKAYIKYGNMNGVDFGLNFKICSLQAGLGINRIKFINNQIETRTKNAKYILDRVRNDNFKESKIIKNGNPNYYTLLFYIKNGNAVNFIDYLDKNGISSDIKRYDFKALYEYPLFKKYFRKCANSENLIKKITTIPVHPGLNKKELNYIIKTINKFNE